MADALLFFAVLLLLAGGLVVVIATNYKRSKSSSLDSISSSGSLSVDQMPAPPRAGTAGGVDIQKLLPQLSPSSPIDIGVPVINKGVATVRACIDSMAKTMPLWKNSDFAEHKGGDGRIYLVHKDDNAALLVPILVDLNARGAKMVNVLKRRVKPDDTIKDQYDTNVSQSSFDRIAQLFADKETSRLLFMPRTISNGFLGFAGAGGRAIFIGSEYVTDRGWKQEYMGYVLHEAAHAAGGSPVEQVAHNREWLRVFRALSLAATDAGVWIKEPMPDWTWERNYQFLGTWGWNDSWYSKSMKLLDTMHWDGAVLAAGQGGQVREYKTLVKARRLMAGARSNNRQTRARGQKTRASASSTRRKSLGKTKLKRRRRSKR